MEPMENVACIARKQAQMLKLPSGFRFHPTDEELLNHYLMNKVIDSRFCAVAIAEVDLNKCEPWDLPGLAKMGETEWYFFCMRDKKYTTGQRTNRATDAGYWKATGNDREIFISKKTKIGMKKTLVFYKGRPPKGLKTNWVMHEFRLEGNQLHYNLSHQQRSEWVVCRVFEKTNSRKKVHLPKLGEEPLPKNGSPLQPFMDSFDPYMSESSQVACFSNQNSTYDGIVVDSMEATLISDSSPVSLGFVNETPMINNVKSVEIALQIGNSSDCPANNSVPQESSMQKTVVGSNGSSAVQNQKTEPSSEQCRVFDDIDFSTLMNNNDLFYESDDGGNQEYSSASAGDVDIGNLWNF